MPKQIRFEKSETYTNKGLHDFIDREFPLLKNGHWELAFQKPNRNNDQNALFWSWLRCISDETGQDSQSLYKYYCEKFNPEGCTYFTNGKFSRGGTSELNTKAFATFLTEIQADVSSELGIRLPTREDANFLEFYNQYFR